MEPPEIVKLVGRPKVKQDRQKEEAVKRRGEWKQSRKGKVTTCNTCSQQNHNSRGCEKNAKQGKQATKEKQPARGKKRQPRRGLIDEEEPSQEDINLTAPNQPKKVNMFLTWSILIATQFLKLRKMMKTLV